MSRPLDSLVLIRGGHSAGIGHTLANSGASFTAFSPASASHVVLMLQPKSGDVGSHLIDTATVNQVLFLNGQFPSK